MALRRAGRGKRKNPRFSLKKKKQSRKRKLLDSRRHRQGKKKVAAHPRRHVGIGKDLPSYIDNFKEVKVKHLGPERHPRVKRELKVPQLRVVEQIRGVKNVPGLDLNHMEDGAQNHQKNVHNNSQQERVSVSRARSAKGPYPTIVICGLGFGGLAVAKKLHCLLKGQGKIIGIDSSDRFMFIPALMALAGGFFAGDQLSVPFSAFAKQVGMEFIQDEIVAIDAKERMVHTKSQKVPYDYVIVSLGAASTPLPSGFDDKTLGLRHVWDAQCIWKAATGAAKRNSQSGSSQAGGSFDVKVGIIGGGPTGIQLASWLKDGLQSFINTNLGKRGKAKVTLFQSGPELVPAIAPKARKASLNVLKKQGVDVVLNAHAKGSKNNVVSFEDGTSHAMDVVVFCGGWRQSRVLNSMGLSMDDRKGLFCDSFLQSVDDPFVFAVGDAVWLVPEDLNIQNWKRAQNARLVGPYVAQNIIAHSRNEPMEPFKVHDTPIILDLRPKSILIYNRKVSTGRIWWHVAQWIRRLNLFVVRHPRIPVPC